MFKILCGREERRKLINEIAEVNLCAGIILAASDFEWTLNRCILVLGKTPTVTLRDKLLDGNKYKTVEQKWSNEIQDVAFEKVFESCKNKHLVTWENIKTAYKVRNFLVHGVMGSIDDEVAQVLIYILEEACDCLCNFAKNRSKDLYGRMKPRKRKGVEAKSKGSTVKKLSDVKKQCAEILECWREGRDQGHDKSST